MPFAIRDDVRLYWRLDGAPDEPVLFLLNSIGTDTSLWDRALPFLTGRFRVLRMDARGHGASDAPNGDYSLAMLGQDALAVMDAAGIEAATVCGVSLGGMIAMTLALAAPARVAALVLACTSPAMDVAAWSARIVKVKAEGMASLADLVMQRFFAPDFIARHPDVVGTTRTGFLSMNPDGYAGCGAAIRDMALLDRLAAIIPPTLVIAGTLDQSTPYEGHADKIVAAIPGARGVMLETAHLACLEDPKGFAEALIAFAAPPAETGTAGAMDTLFEAGLKNRRTVLGDAWVDRSLANRTPFNADFQAMITRIAWHEIWGRPGLDHRTRRLLVLAITAALGRWEEFRLHVKAGLAQNGFTVEELKETLMQTAIYAGVPAANTAFAEAGEILRARADGDHS